ncbi:hypothetical protein BKA56DRAFT_611167 [Ilyonectria sp. MPI-CAGE-AT-0026]|nr:hypothetical protein BKA56DRAFT_611167 [Ilyonectria sp. MPI-CAGE-AT-0026]
MGILAEVSARAGESGGTLTCRDPRIRYPYIECLILSADMGARKKWKLGTGQIRGPTPIGAFKPLSTNMFRLSNSIMSFPRRASVFAGVSSEIYSDDGRFRCRILIIIVKDQDNALNREAWTCQKWTRLAVEPRVADLVRPRELPVHRIGIDWL